MVLEAVKVLVEAMRVLLEASIVLVEAVRLIIEDVRVLDAVRVLILFIKEQVPALRVLEEA